MFKTVDIVPHEHWFDGAPGNKTLLRYYVDKIQMIDPLYQLYSEVEHPIKFREYIKKWRMGSETRFKMPYYPEPKEPSKYFNYH